MDWICMVLCKTLRVFWQVPFIHTVVLVPFGLVFFPPVREGRGMLLLFFPLRGCGAYWGQIQFSQWVKAGVHRGRVTSSPQEVVPVVVNYGSSHCCPDWHKSCFHRELFSDQWFLLVFCLFIWEHLDFSASRCFFLSNCWFLFVAVPNRIPPTTDQ